MDALSIRFTEFENNAPPLRPYVGLRATLLSHGFSGLTDTCVSRLDLEAFLTDLGTLVQTMQGTIDLVAGTEDQVRFSIRISLADRLGHLRVAVRLARARRPSESIAHGVEAEFLTDVALVDNFRRDLGRMLKTQCIEAEAVLFARQ